MALDDKNSRGEIQTNWELLRRPRAAWSAASPTRTSGSASTDGPIRPSLLNPRNRQTLLFQPVTSELAGRLRPARLERHRPASSSWSPAATTTARCTSAQFSPKASVVWQRRPEPHACASPTTRRSRSPNYSEFFLQARRRRRRSTWRRSSVLRHRRRRLRLRPRLRPGEAPARDTTPDTRVLALGNEDLEIEEVKTVGDRLHRRARRQTASSRSTTTRARTTTSSPTCCRSSARRSAASTPTSAPTSPRPAWRRRRRASSLALLRGRARCRYFILHQQHRRHADPRRGLVHQLRHRRHPGRRLRPQHLSQRRSGRSTPTTPGSTSRSRTARPGLDRLLLPNSPGEQVRRRPGLRRSTLRRRASPCAGSTISAGWSGPSRATSSRTAPPIWSPTSRSTTTGESALNVANVLDEEHWESFGGDILGRRALGSVTFSW